MRFPVLLSVVFLFICCNVNAQNLSWFKGAWYGETYFPNGPVTKRIIIKMQVERITGNHFTATLSNLYPNDTTVRLKRLIEGNIIDKRMFITANKELYIRDPRTRNFWPDCTGCPLQSSFKINNKKIEIALTTSGCGNICDGQTFFQKDTIDFDANTKADLAKWMLARGENMDVKSVQKPVLKDSVTVKKKAIKDTALSAHSSSKKDTAKGIFAIRKDTLFQRAETVKDTMPEAFTNRNTRLINSYQVSSPHIIIQLYDNAEIDGDMVTVFHNGKRIADHQSLTHKAIVFTVDASAQDKHHEFVMIAENLGLIPPNTALMRITAGNQKFEIEVSSDFENNAKINIDYNGN